MVNSIDFEQGICLDLFLFQGISLDLFVLKFHADTIKQTNNKM